MILVSLTSRERDIADLASLGYSMRYIGARLNISPRTVETHLCRVYGKLGITSKDALIESRERGIIAMAVAA